jgi:two-component system NtrC family response regulator
MKILIIDDEAPQRDSLKGFLEHIHHEVWTADQAADGLALLERQPMDVVITDYRMPGADGVQVVEQARTCNPLVAVILITAFGEIDLAVKAMKAGAHDFLTKPIDLEQLELILLRIAAHKQVVNENVQLRELLQEHAALDQIISVSAPMEKALNLAARIANSNSSVLIRGETGVGKEIVARAIHCASPRRDHPFVAVNCSALNEHLLESELFGHERGAFTGAIAARVGRFEGAAGGTLFLDEIGDLPPTVQVKLLRAIQDKTIERVGSNKTIVVDVRLIAATHRDLADEMAKGHFREDLYYRLNVVTIWVPPLRERRDDIPVLAQHFLRVCTAERHRNIKGFTPEALDILVRYSYPGNVRELENAVERAVLLTRTEYIQSCDLPETMQSATGTQIIAGSPALTLPLSGDMPDAVEQLEKAMVLRALQQHNGNQTKAAKSIGISEKSVRDRLKKWGIAVGDHDTAPAE